MARLIVVYDNERFAEDFEKAWGFSCLVRFAGKTVLFDTGGDPEVLRHNLDAAGFHPEDLAAVVISHMHWDHVGGLPAVLHEGLRVFLPASATDEDLLKIAESGATVERVTEPRQLLPGVWSTGTIEASVPEQSLVIRTGAGLVVLTGCAHPGVVRIVETVERIFPGQPVALVAGGFHLKDQDLGTIRATARRLIELGVQRVGPAHCSGSLARSVFAQLYDDAYVRVGAGLVLDFPNDD